MKNPAMVNERIRKADRFFLSAIIAGIITIIVASIALVTGSVLLTLIGVGGAIILTILIVFSLTILVKV